MTTISSARVSAISTDSASRRWVETRFLTRQAGEWAGYSYLWNDDQSDAELVAAEGVDRDYEICVPRSDENPGGVKKQRWHYPSRVECMVCHSRAANFVLGLSTAQMNKEHDYGGVNEHQFRVLAQLGLVKEPKNRRTEEPASTGIDPLKLPRLVNPYDEAELLEARARSYLHANCSICHMQAGGGNVADSIPANEYQETVNKAKGMMRAIAFAERCGEG